MSLLHRLYYIVPEKLIVSLILNRKFGRAKRKKKKNRESIVTTWIDKYLAKTIRAIESVGRLKEKEIDKEKRGVGGGRGRRERGREKRGRKI